MILLDTHTLIWWVNESNKLSKSALGAIKKNLQKDQVIVSSVSIWETALLVKKDKITLSLHLDRWIEELENTPGLKFIPIDNKIAALSVNLPEPLHNDPADRIIVATALYHGATLITADARLLKYPKVKTGW